MRELGERFASLSRTSAPDLWPEIEGREPRNPIEPSSARRAVVAVVALVVAIAGIGIAAVTFGGSDRPAASGTPGPPTIANGPIFFRVGGGDGGSHIEAVQTDGSGQHVVLEGEPMRIAQIAWSPDGTRIAYQDPIADERGIFVANPDGADALRLTDGINDAWPSWSPDGTKIVFSSSRYDPSIELCEPGADFRCSTDVYVMDADGTNVIRLTNGGAPEFQPVWSPDGRRIAFVRSTGGTGGEAPLIFTMNADGSDVQQVSSGDGGSDFSPSWSPDGSEIVFLGFRFEDTGIWIAAADGSDERQVFGAGWYSVDDPVWSPAGDLIAFVGSPEGGEAALDDELYVMRPDGTEVTKIADAPGIGVAGDVAWQPVPIEQTSPPTPTPVVSTSVSNPIPIESSPGAVSALTYGFGSMWVASFDDSMEGWITRLDLTTGEQLARISTGEVFPTWEIGGGGLAIGIDSVWLAGAARAPGEPGGVHAFVSRIDPASNDVVDTIDLGTGSGADVVEDSSGVWALSFSVTDQGPATMVVTRIDPTSGGVVETIPLDATYGHHIFAVHGFIVAETNDVHEDTVAGTVLNIIDPTTGSVTRVPLGTDASTAAGDDALWALSGESITSIEPGTGRVLSTWGTLNTGDAGAVGDGGVWFFDPSDRSAVHRFDPIAGRVDLSVDIRSGSTPIAMAVAPESVWVLNYEGSVTRVGLTPSP
jgi:dipeptidyl aminopeptidase/acylaminoacyl peptidase